MLNGYIYLLRYSVESWNLDSSFSKSHLSYFTPYPVFRTKYPTPLPSPNQPEHKMQGTGHRARTLNNLEMSKTYIINTENPIRVLTIFAQTIKIAL